MNLLRTVAVEDEAPALKRLVRMIEENPNLNLAGTAKSSASAKEIIIDSNLDLLLLDIQLKDATAFDLLQEIENHFSGKIIFITAYDSYAVKAFELEAMDYLLKPYTQERFNKAIERVISKTDNLMVKNIIQLLKEQTVHSPKTLSIPEGNKNHYIEKDKLLYLTADGYYTHFILKDGKKLIRISLKKLEEFLPDNFVRINKSTIINKDFIIESVHHKAVAKVIMADEYEFYVSENYLKKFNS